MTNKNVWIGLFASGALFSLAAGELEAADNPNASLNEIVVTATRVPEPIGQALEPVLVIDRAALEDSLAIDVGDVLRFHAGIDIGRTGGAGQPLSLFIRGTNSDQSIVMIDGVRINAGTQALAPLMNISPELFDRDRDRQGSPIGYLRHRCHRRSPQPSHSH